MLRCNFLPHTVCWSWGWYLQLSCKTGLCSSKFFQEFLSFLSLYIGWNVLIISEVLPSVRPEKGRKVFVSLLMMHDLFFLKGGKASDLSQGCRWKNTHVRNHVMVNMYLCRIIEVGAAWHFLPELFSDGRSVACLQTSVWSLWKFLLNCAHLEEDIRH